jgi:hypothetical protein
MGEQNISATVDEEQLRNFMKAILLDVHALETHARRGPLRDRACAASAPSRRCSWSTAAGAPGAAPTRCSKRSPPAVHLRAGAVQPRVQPDPAGVRRQVPVGDGGRAHELLRDGPRRRRARCGGGIVLLTGILPTLRRGDLTLASMVQNPRYLELNRAISQLRGGEFHVPHQGRRRLRDDARQRDARVVQHELPGPLPGRPAGVRQALQLAQAITGAGAVGGHQLAGAARHRLWRETRVALFQQSVDARSTGAPAARRPAARQLRRRLGARERARDLPRGHRPLPHRCSPPTIDENPEAVLARGGVPALTALRCTTAPCTAGTAPATASATASRTCASRTACSRRARPSSTRSPTARSSSA